MFISVDCCKACAFAGRIGNARISAESVKKVKEKFRVNPFAMVPLCTPFLLAAIVVLPPTIFASGVDATTVYARAWAVLAAEPYVKKDFKCARITGAVPSLRVKGKRCGNSCLKGMNIGSGWEQKSIEQRCPFTFMIRTENSRNNQTVGRKPSLRLHTSFRKPQAVTLSSLAWRNRQQPTRIGCWRMVSDKVDS